MTISNVVAFVPRVKLYASDDLKVVRKIGIIDFLKILLGIREKKKPRHTATMMHLGDHYRYFGKDKKRYFSFSGRYRGQFE